MADQVKEYKAKWNEKNRDSISKRRKQYREKYKTRIAKDKSNYYIRNRDAILEKHRLRYMENPQVSKEKTALWRKLNPEKAKTLDANKKARRKGAEGRYVSSDIAKLADMQKWRCANCACCIKNGYHVDHIMPIALGGTNWPYNLQLLCPTCNMRKNAKHPLVWAAQNGRLL